MKSATIPIFVLCAALLAMSPAIADSPPAATAALASIVTLTGPAIDGKSTATGYGFAGIAKGIVVTTLHFAQSVSGLSATFADGRKVDVAGIVDTDTKYDLALLKIEDTTATPLPLADGAPPDVSPETVFVAGPDGAPAAETATFGPVQTDKHTILYGFHADSVPLSGTPIVSANGEVVGIVDDQLGKMLAAPATEITKLSADGEATPFEAASSGDDSGDTGDKPGGKSKPGRHPGGRRPGSDTPTADDTAKMVLPGLFAQADRVFNDAGVVVALCRNQIAHGRADRADIPAPLHDVENRAKTVCEQVEDAKSTDATLEPIRRVYRDRLKAVVRAIEEMDRAILSGIASSNWTKFSVAECNRALDSWNSQPNLDTVEYKALVAMPDYDANLPDPLLSSAYASSLDFGLAFLADKPDTVAVIFDRLAAGKCGFRAGDVVVKVNDQHVGSVVDMIFALQSLPDTSAKVTVTRGGRQKTLTVKGWPVAAAPAVPGGEPGQVEPSVVSL